MSPKLTFSRQLSPHLVIPENKAITTQLSINETKPVTPQLSIRLRQGYSPRLGFYKRKSETIDHTYMSIQEIINDVTEYIYLDDVTARYTYLFLRTYFKDKMLYSIDVLDIQSKQLSFAEINEVVKELFVNIPLFYQEAPPYRISHHIFSKKEITTKEFLEIK